LLVSGLVLLFALLIMTGCGLFKEAPIVSINANPAGGEEPLTVAFSATVVQKSADIVLCEWSFGDGATGKGTSTVHTYLEAGDYKAQLRATDKDGRVSDWTSQSIEVRPAPKPPTCNGVNIRNETGPSACPPFCVGDLLRFSPINPSDPQNGTLTYFWNFGDGRGEAGHTVDHAYCYPGRYTITVTIKSSKGTSMDFTRNVTIQECCSCLPKFAIDPLGHTICSGKSITLSAKFPDPCCGCCQVDTKEIILDLELESKYCPPPDYSPCPGTGCCYNGYFEWVVDLDGTRLANHVRGSSITITPCQTGSMVASLYYTCGSKSHVVKETYTVKCCDYDCCSSSE